MVKKSAGLLLYPSPHYRPPGRRQRVQRRGGGSGRRALTRAGSAAAAVEVSASFDPSWGVPACLAGVLPRSKPLPPPLPRLPGSAGSAAASCCPWFPSCTCQLRAPTLYVCRVRTVSKHKGIRPMAGEAGRLARCWTSGRDPPWPALTAPLRRPQDACLICPITRAALLQLVVCGVAGMRAMHATAMGRGGQGRAGPNEM